MLHERLMLCESLRHYGDTPVNTFFPLTLNEVIGDI